MEDVGTGCRPLFRYPSRFRPVLHAGRRSGRAALEQRGNADLPGDLSPGAGFARTGLCRDAGARRHARGRQHRLPAERGLPEQDARGAASLDGPVQRPGYLDAAADGAADGARRLFRRPHTLGPAAGRARVAPRRADAARGLSALPLAARARRGTGRGRPFRRVRRPGLPGRRRRGGGNGPDAGGTRPDGGFPGILPGEFRRGRFPGLLALALRLPALLYPRLLPGRLPRHRRHPRPVWRSGPHGTLLPAHRRPRRRGFPQLGQNRPGSHRQAVPAGLCRSLRQPAGLLGGGRSGPRAFPSFGKRQRHAAPLYGVPEPDRRRERPVCRPDRHHPPGPAGAPGCGRQRYAAHPAGRFHLASPFQRGHRPPVLERGGPRRPLAAAFVVGGAHLRRADLPSADEKDTLFPSGPRTGPSGARRDGISRRRQQPRGPAGRPRRQRARGASGPGGPAGARDRLGGRGTVRQRHRRRGRGHFPRGGLFARPLFKTR